MGKLSQVFVVSVPMTTTAGANTSFEDILHCIGVEHIASLIWGVERLDCANPEAQDFCDRVDADPSRRILIDGLGLLQTAPTLKQVIEGVFIGYLSWEDTKEFIKNGWASIDFARSHSLVAIVAVDGHWFDVYLHSREYGERLTRCFKGARWEDPRKYFPLQD